MLKKIFSILLIALLTSCSSSSKFIIKFDNTKEMSGEKFSLKDINPNLPDNWDDYNYVVLKYKITTAQRFRLGFTTKTGYNELRVMSYVPNAWNELAIPLKYFREEPDPALDLAATYNHARYTGWVNLGGVRYPLQGVDSVGIRIHKPIGNPVFELANITLSKNDPGDKYLEKKPAVDKFGQSNLVDYEGKIKSLEELKLAWSEEENEVLDTMSFNYDMYGGYKGEQYDITGYFYTKKIDNKWWFIDPLGHKFLSVGVDCISFGGGGNVNRVDQRRNMYEILPPENIMKKYSRRGNYSYGIWNLYRRFGDDLVNKSKDLIIKRMTNWGINTIANWSDPRIIDMNKKACLLRFDDLGIENDLMGLTDVYINGYQDKIDENISTYVEKYKTNPWVIGYFIGNEPAWINNEDRLASIIINGKDRPIKTALKKYLTKHGDTKENRKEFIYLTFEKFITYVNNTLKKYDPNHLILGIRFGQPSSVDNRLLEICSKGFDVLSFNSYTLRPEPEMLDNTLKITGLPMLIGEYHFGTVTRGRGQSLWQVPTEKDRGVAYRYYTEQAYSHPGLIGTGYFQWNDQDLTGRFDGENYHCGLVDVTDRPYTEQVDAMKKTAKSLYEVHSGLKAPFSEIVKDARGNEDVPLELWNK